MVKNTAKSVQARLLNVAKEHGENFNTLMVQYALQRLLYRLSISQHVKNFLLKGSWLFVVWDNTLHRPTKDIDLLGFGNSDAEYLLTVFKAVAELAVDEPDGLVFEASDFKATEIKKEGDYQGVRITGLAKLDVAIIPLQIDKGMFLGLHSLLFPTKVKAATANMPYYFALFASDSLRSPTGPAGQAAQQLSLVLVMW